MKKKKHSFTAWTVDEPNPLAIIFYWNDKYSKTKKGLVTNGFPDGKTLIQCRKSSEFPRKIRIIVEEV